MDEDEALRRLRAADPAADLDASALQWVGSPAESAAASVSRPDLDDHSIDAVAGRPGPYFDHRGKRPARRRVLAVVAAAGAAVVVAAVAIGTTTLHDHRPTASGPGDGTSVSVPSDPSTTPPTTTPRARALALLADLLTKAPVLPGSTASADAPTPSLRTAFTEPGSPNFVERHTWWTAPGSIQVALDFFNSHVPDGLQPGAHGSSSGTATSREFVSYDGSDTAYATDVSLQITIEAYQGGIALEVDAQAIWLPQRDPRLTIAEATSVEVTVHRGDGSTNGAFPGAATVQRTLDGAVVDRLARDANALSVDVTGGLRQCPMAASAFVDDLVFATPAGAVRVTATVSGCAGVIVTAPDGTHQDLEPGSLNAAVLTALGLPTDYGY